MPDSNFVLRASHFPANPTKRRLDAATVFRIDLPWRLLNVILGMLTARTRQSAQIGDDLLYGRPSAFFEAVEFWAEGCPDYTVDASSFGPTRNLGNGIRSRITTLPRTDELVPFFSCDLLPMPKRGPCLVEFG